MVGSGEDLDFTKDILKGLLAADARVFAYRSTDYARDMGTPKRLQQVDADWRAGKIDIAHSSRGRPAVFLDRDGTLNIEKGGVRRAEELELLPGVAEALIASAACGVSPVVLTNQSVVARGQASESDVAAVHRRLEWELGKAGAYLDGYLCLPASSGSRLPGLRVDLKIACDCRKPATGLVERARRDLAIDLSTSWMIGDQTRDVEMARRAGLRSILVQTGAAGRDGQFQCPADYVAPNCSAPPRSCWPSRRRGARDHFAHPVVRQLSRRRFRSAGHVSSAKWRRGALTTIDQSVYVTANRKSTTPYALSYSRTEESGERATRSASAVRESPGCWVSRAALRSRRWPTSRAKGRDRLVQLDHRGLLNALHARYGRHAKAESGREKARQVEIERCDEPIGKQDQYAAACRYSISFASIGDDRRGEEGRLRAWLSPISAGAADVLYTGLTLSASRCCGGSRRTLAPAPKSTRHRRHGSAGGIRLWRNCARGKPSSPGARLMTPADQEAAGSTA